jgi:hypothetical protein
MTSIFLLSSSFLLSALEERCVNHSTATTIPVNINAKMAIICTAMSANYFINRLVLNACDGDLFFMHSQSISTA